MIVRPREDSDAEPLVAALGRTHALDGYPVRPVNVRWGWLVDGVEQAWTALVDDRPVGHVGVAEPPEGSLLTDGSLEATRLFVDPEARGHGVAGALLDVAEEHVREQGRTIGLEVVDGSDAAIAFYLRRGWTEVGRRVATWTGPDGTSPTLIGFAAPR